MVVGDDRGYLSYTIERMQMDGEELGGPEGAGMTFPCHLSESCTLHPLLYHQTFLPFDS